MTKSIAMLLVVGLAGALAFGPRMGPAASGGALSMPAGVPILFQEDTIPRRWDPAWMSRVGMDSLSDFRVPVTVRSEQSTEVSVLGTRVMTIGSQQRWVFGDSSDGERLDDSLSVSRAPYWSTLPFPRDFYERIDSTVAASLSLGIPGDSVFELIHPLIPDSLNIGGGVTVSGDTVPSILRRPIPELRISRTTDSGDLEPPPVCFEVEGLMICLKPWTAHEGFLERVHIDYPDNAKFNEVTVVGHYSRSARVTALRFPAMPCVWCGRVQVCSAGAGCP